jgi:hypothetical protein
MAPGESVKRFARNEFLGDLSFEFDAMGTVPGHGFHPLKARQSQSIPNLQDVHREGRTPEPVNCDVRFAPESRHSADIP